MVKYTIFIGNPGTGKSTLLNSLVGEVLFHSGVSYGKGLTTVLQLEQAGNGDIYGDTPGLQDIEMREKAAEEISRALRSGEGDYKLVFVVTQEAGRVRAADGVTMKLVLDALPKDRVVPFGIVVNKLSKRLKHDLESDNEKYLRFAACLNEGPDHPTAYIHLYPEIEELKDADDELHEATPALKQWLDMLPAVHIRPEDVEDVKASEFEVQVEALETQLKALEEDNEALQMTILRDREEVEEQFENMKKAQEEALTKAREDSETKMRQLEENHRKQVSRLREEHKEATGKEYELLVKKIDKMEENHKKAMADAQKREEDLKRSIREANRRPSRGGGGCVIL